jgi:uncharacterized FlaG/YvyC family protein
MPMMSPERVRSSPPPVSPRRRSTEDNSNSGSGAKKKAQPVRVYLADSTSSPFASASRPSGSGISSNFRTLLVDADATMRTVLPTIVDKFCKGMLPDDRAPYERYLLSFRLYAVPAKASAADEPDGCAIGDDDRPLDAVDRMSQKPCGYSHLELRNPMATPRSRAGVSPASSSTSATALGSDGSPSGSTHDEPAARSRSASMRITHATIKAAFSSSSTASSSSAASSSSMTPSPTGASAADMSSVTDAAQLQQTVAKLQAQLSSAQKKLSVYKQKETATLSVVDMSSPRIIRQLAEVGGSMASVYLVDIGGWTAVMKELEVSDEPEMSKPFETEISIFETLPHSPYLVRYLGHSKQGKVLRLFTSLYSGTLAEYMARKKEPLPSDELKCVVLHVARGVSVLHKHKIIHRDVKASSMLLLLFFFLRESMRRLTFS